jgi:gamma-glutamyltranspeptidase/glutathione hydrolase
MLSAMTPTIVLDGSGQVRLVTGSPGGPTIISTVTQMVSNVVDWEMDLGEATSAPRLHHQHLPDILRVERGALPDGTISALRAMGHTVQERGGYQGDAQSIVVDRGQLLGAGDPRRN